MNKDTIYEKIDFTESILKHNVDLVNFADTKAGLGFRFSRNNIESFNIFWEN